uniref:uncharacterized protein n=2 Tax=Myxine glutinosa TaxID=7769 RepID=UPI00358EF82E
MLLTFAIFIFYLVIILNDRRFWECISASFAELRFMLCNCALKSGIRQKMMSSPPFPWLFCHDCVCTGSAIHIIIIASIISIVAAVTINNTMKIIIVSKKLLQIVKAIYKSHHSRNGKSQEPLKILQRKFDPEFLRRVPRGYEVKPRNNRDRYSIPLGMKMETMEEASPCVDEIDVLHCIPLGMKIETMEEHGRNDRDRYSIPLGMKMETMEETTSPCVDGMDVYHSIPLGMKIETMEEASPCVDEIDVYHSIPLGMKIETMEEASPCVYGIDVYHSIALGMKIETMVEASPCVDGIDVYHSIPLGMKMETMVEASPCVDEIDVYHSISLGMKIETMEQASPCVDEIDVYHSIPLGMKIETMEEASPCVDGIDVYHSIALGMKIETMVEASPCVDGIDVYHSIPLGMKMETMVEASPCVDEIDVYHSIPLGMKIETMEQASPCVDEIDVYHSIPLGKKIETMEEASPCVDEIDVYPCIPRPTMQPQTSDSHRGTFHVPTKEVQVCHKSLLQMRKFHQGIELDHQISVQHRGQVELITWNQATSYAFTFDAFPWWLKKSGCFSGHGVNNMFTGTDDIGHLTLCTTPHSCQNESGAHSKLMEDSKENAIIGIQEKYHAQRVRTHPITQHQSAVTIQAHFRGYLTRKFPEKYQNRNQELTLHYSDGDMQSMNRNVMSIFEKWQESCYNGHVDFRSSRSGNRSASPIESRRLLKIGSNFQTEPILESQRPSSQKLTRGDEKGKAGVAEKGLQRKTVLLHHQEPPTSTKNSTNKKGSAPGKKKPNVKDQHKPWSLIRGLINVFKQRKIAPPQKLSQQRKIAPPQKLSQQRKMSPHLHTQTPPQMLSQSKSHLGDQQVLPAPMISTTGSSQRIARIPIKWEA